ncbi:MAG: Signal transduction histidine kinase [Saliniramus fredricksonii]|uniref:histidine kinase n=1 Tax=Saliniramus fredricksonii TaxID=1653334 RepID=A0A0N8KEN4_9HYPH|nr:MAG: Signal transduction histidine kinase [Saliniramus fredricksonii]SCC82249.1 Signal transduction histidine kinase [Saliniramus fredricksonii]
MGSGVQKNQSINFKLGRLVLVAVGIALICGTAINLWREVERYGQQKHEQLATTAHVFAAAAAEAVEARDRAQILSVIRAISRVPQMNYAVVHDAEGRLLAELGAAILLSDDRDVMIRPGERVNATRLIRSRSVRTEVPIDNGGETIGSLTLISDTSDLAERMKDMLLVAVTASALAAAIGLLISIKMQRHITRPLLNLAHAMAGIRLSHDYEAYVAAETDDEIGNLAKSFNTMIGEIRKRDTRLARQRDQLEQDVAARTREFLAAKEVAEQASRAKSDFLATMSHEIRTPMNGMLVMAELLAKSDLPERQRRQAEVITRSGQSLLAIINDILDFAKVEAGKLELERVPVDLHEVADTVTALFGARARENGIDLAAVIAPGTPRHVIGDPTRITQIISNLTSNALKFTEKGHVVIRLACADGMRTRLRIAIEDTGIGIAPDKLATIFSAFSQADQSTTRRFGGTGLGLTICKRLVEAMDGEIGATSEVGKGSAFSFDIPLQIPVGEAYREAPPPQPHALPLMLGSAGSGSRQALAAVASRSGFALVETHEERGYGRATITGFWLISAEGLVARKARPKGAKAVIALAPIGAEAGEIALGRGLADAVMRLPVSINEAATLFERMRAGKPLVASAPKPGADGDSLPQFAQARVLVADDSPVNREVASAALARFGINPDLASDGLQALRQTHVADYDLILMDVSMPEMDGYEATRRIRQDEARKGRAPKRIVALTAHVVGAEALGWQEAGMDGVLHKPFTIAQLGETLSRHIGQAAPDEIEAGPPAASLDDTEQVPQEPDLAGQADIVPAKTAIPLQSYVTVLAQKPTETSEPEDQGEPGEAATAPSCVPEVVAAATQEQEQDNADARPVLDEDLIGQLQQMGETAGPDFLRRVLGLYLEHAPKALGDLREAASHGDPQQIASAAHALKSMSANIGALPLVDRLGAMETAAQQEAISPDAAELDDIESMLDTVFAALTARFGEALAGDAPARSGDQAPKAGKKRA